jgi:hypothetical protein
VILISGSARGLAMLVGFIREPCRIKALGPGRCVIGYGSPETGARDVCGAEVSPPEISKIKAGVA